MQIRISHLLLKNVVCGWVTCGNSVIRVWRRLVRLWWLTLLMRIANFSGWWDRRGKYLIYQICRVSCFISCYLSDNSLMFFIRIVHFFTQNSFSLNSSFFVLSVINLFLKKYFSLRTMLFSLLNFLLYLLLALSIIRCIFETITIWCNF